MSSIIYALRNIAGSLLLLLAANASAVLPDSGWYSNAAESGRGFNIEIQNNVLSIAGFMYDASGNQIWVFSGGPMSSDRTYSGAAYKTANGQPLGGAYHVPTSVPFGMATVTFTTTTTANININGFVFTVARLAFGFDFTSTTQPLLGEFAFVMGTPSLAVYFGQRITLANTQLIDGSLYATGNLTGESGSNYRALGQYSTELGKWAVLLDSSASYYQFFVFTLTGLNFAEGDVYTYLKTDLPSGSLNAVGNRIRSAQAAAGANAPGTIKGLRPAGAARTDTLDAAIASVQEVHQLDAASIDSLRQLESALQASRHGSQYQ